MPDLFIFLVLGHFFGDFAFQTNKMAQKKKSSKQILSIHVLVYTLTIALFLYWGLYSNNNFSFFTLTSLAVLVFLYVEHWLQDYFKGVKFNGSKQAFFLDQGLHIIILFIVRLYIYHG